jgi:adenine-specific DNA-methyltransferase
VRSVEEFLNRVEERRIQVGSSIPAARRAELGQFFTPRDAAVSLAEMQPITSEPWRLLDPGAGVGTLSAALVARWLKETELPSMAVTAHEVDPRLLAPLTATLTEARELAAARGRELEVDIRSENFILNPPTAGRSNAVLMNPPYGKLRADSPERAALAKMDDPIRVPNLYAAFLVRAIRSLSRGGTLVAITPRSFANGPYFRDLRTDLFARASFERIHVYEARDRVFADAGVLQENVVFSMRAGAEPGEVSISSSLDSDATVTRRTCEHDSIVYRDDPERFVHLPLDSAAVAVAELMSTMPARLPDFGLRVSTGRVVDFRSRRHLRAKPGPSTVPLVYPRNFQQGSIAWPILGRKPQALIRTKATEGLLLPNSHYVLVKRMSSKEETRRVVASLASPEDFGDAPVVAFENHLNVIHADGEGLDPDLARGLTTYLNSKLVDDAIRLFSGHTQINAADLRQLRYPSREDLVALGKVAGGDPVGEVDQAALEGFAAEPQTDVVAA